MSELTANVSWLAVIVGAIASFLLGWLWYSERLFGKRWAEGVGVELGSANEMPVAAMARQVLGLFLMSWFVAVTAAHELLLTVVLATLAFAVLAESGAHFRRNSSYAARVDASFLIAALVVMIISNGIF